MTKENDKKVILLLTPHGNTEVDIASTNLIQHLAKEKKINSVVLEVPRDLTAEEIIKDYKKRNSKAPDQRASLEHNGMLLLCAKRNNLDVHFGDVETKKLSELTDEYNKEIEEYSNDDHFLSASAHDRFLIEVATLGTSQYRQHRSKAFLKEILKAYEKGGVLADIGNGHGDIIDLLHNEIGHNNVVIISVIGSGCDDLDRTFSSSSEVKGSSTVTEDTIEESLIEAGEISFFTKTIYGYAPRIYSDNEYAEKIYAEMNNIIQDFNSAHIVKEQLEEQNYQMVDVPRDGNCLYRAIALQMGPEIEQQDIRQIAGSYIESHPEEFQDFLSNGSIMAQEVANAFISGVWADHIQIQAISNALNINILIHTSDGTRFISPTNTQSFDQISYNLFYDGSHYMAIYPPHVRNQNFDNIFHQEPEFSTDHSFSGLVSADTPS